MDVFAWAYPRSFIGMGAWSIQEGTPGHIKEWFDRGEEERTGDMAVCVMVRNERIIIEEWLAFQALQGMYVPQGAHKHDTYIRGRQTSII